MDLVDAGVLKMLGSCGETQQRVVGKVHSFPPSTRMKDAPDPRIYHYIAGSRSGRGAGQQVTLGSGMHTHKIQKIRQNIRI